MQFLLRKLQVLLGGGSPYAPIAALEQLACAVHLQREANKGEVTNMPSTKTATATLPTHIDLSETEREPMIELLNKRLADTADLYSQVKQAHWNVKGPNFFQLHQLFDQLAGEVFPYIDLIAERATALGGVAMGTVRMAAANSMLPEYPIEATEGQKHVKALIDRYAVFTASIRKAIDFADEHHDRSTADLFTEISRTADKQLWFLEAHVQQ